MAVFSDITNGLLVAVKAMAATIPLPVQYEGIAFKSNNAAYLRMTVLPAQTEINTLGRQGFNLNTGILQIDLFYPSNSGISTIVSTADEVYEYFYENRLLPLNTINIKIERTTIETRLNDAGYIQQPISIEYSVCTQRLN